MASDIGAMLAGQLMAPEISYVSTRELVRLEGGGEAGRRAAQEALSGMSGPPQRGEYATEAEHRAAQTVWRTAGRRVQRATTTKEGAQTRGSTPVRLTPEQAQRARASATTAKIRAFRRTGMSARVVMVLRMPTPDARKRPDTRLKRMPAGGEPVNIPKEATREIVTAALTPGGLTEAGGLFIEAFLNEYGLPAAEWDEIVSVKAWPTGWDEPYPEG